MPCYSVREFGEITGIVPKNIHTYATRGKVIKNGKGLIDTSEPINLEFLEKHRIKEEKKVKSRPKAKGHKKKDIDEDEDEIIDERKKAQKEKLDLELKAKKIELSLKEIELSKKRGELVSLEQTGNIVSQYVSSTNRKMLESLETLIRSICSRHLIDSSKCGKYLIEVKETINQINKESVEEVFKNLENMA